MRISLVAALSLAGLVWSSLAAAQTSPNNLPVASPAADAPASSEGTDTPTSAEGTLSADDLPDADEPALEAPGDGVWTWVSRFERGNADPEMEQAVEEALEEERQEAVLTDEFAVAAIPVDYYTDPSAALHTDPLFLDRVDPAEFDIPVVVNASVEKWVRYFTGPGRRHYARWMGRSTTYRPMMYEKLDAAGLPRDLVYLSMIESGYNAHAYSHAAAAGLWQFIPSTGRMYGLRVDSWVDQRRDPHMSTDSSIKFLGELNDMFGDWYLAWGAYNAGPGRIRRAVRNSGSEDFWTIQAGDHLHPETDNYVPKIIAAAIIGKHPERYGFTDIEFQAPLSVEQEMVEGQVEISVLAGCAGLSVDEFKRLNPSLRAFTTPTGSTRINVPSGMQRQFVAALEAVPASRRVTTTYHTVRRGETLSVIAGRYGSSVSNISRANGLHNADHIYVGMRLRIPRDGSAAALASTSSAPTSSATRPTTPSRPSSHTVRRGDTLSEIATRYGVSQGNLKSWNSLRSDTVYLGQVLKVSGSGSSTASSGGSTRTHVVARGENLSTIAARYGVSLANVKSWNNISNASHITVGQRLSIRGSGPVWNTVTVRNGDSLGRIATREGVSVSQLREWNDISGSVIHPGQRLRVRR
ncbi:MAG: membrane-bound lytic murein transglycosylase D [Myxococcota bacterium]|jgi:membrane-bound lytic murein transglycosylase D